jgi:hypothetical protein
MADAQYYRDLALALIPQLLEQELALIAPAEVAAKLADDPRLPLPGRVKRIDPHHLGWATNELIRSGQISQLFHRTKGARTVRLIVPTNQHLRIRAINDAVQRKSALQARYLGWASGTPNHPGVLGAGGESVVHSALITASPHGYYLLNPTTGQTRMLRGLAVPGGALDNAAILTAVDRQTNTPTGTFDVLVEVKNVRHWLYPGDSEVHQLLWKAAALQQALPDVPILPVLVCREAAHITIKLTYNIGVYVIRTVNQLAPESLDADRLNEVVSELGYRLARSNEPAPALVSHFTTKIPGAAAELAQRWRAVGAGFLRYYELLRRDDIDREQRDDLRSQLLDAVGIIDHTTD